MVNVVGAAVVVAVVQKQGEAEGVGVGLGVRVVESRSSSRSSSSRRTAAAATLARVVRCCRCGCSNSSSIGTLLIGSGFWLIPYDDNIGNSKMRGFHAAGVLMVLALGAVAVVVVAGLSIEGCSPPKATGRADRHGS